MMKFEMKLKPQQKRIPFFCDIDGTFMPNKMVGYLDYFISSAIKDNCLAQTIEKLKGQGYPIKELDEKIFDFFNNVKKLEKEYDSKTEFIFVSEQGKNEHTRIYLNYLFERENMQDRLKGFLVCDILEENSICRGDMFIAPNGKETKMKQQSFSDSDPVEMRMKKANCISEYQKTMDNDIGDVAFCIYAGDDWGHSTFQDFHMAYNQVKGEYYKNKPCFFIDCGDVIRHHNNGDWVRTSRGNNTIDAADKNEYKRLSYDCMERMPYADFTKRQGFWHNNGKRGEIDGGVKVMVDGREVYEKQNIEVISEGIEQIIKLREKLILCDNLSPEIQK